MSDLFRHVILPCTPWAAIAVSLFAGAYAAGAAPSAQRLVSTPPTPELAEQLREFQQRHGGKALWNTRTRLPERIVGLHAKIAPRLTQENADQAARQFLSTNRALLGVDPDALVCRLAAERRGRILLKYQQTHRGVPVDGAEVGFVANSDGTLLRYTATFAPNIGIAADAKITQEQAVRAARLALGNTGQAASVDKVERSIRQHDDAQHPRYRLVYRVFVNTRQTHHSPYRLVEVDANTGEVIRQGDAHPSRAHSQARPGAQP